MPKEGEVIERSSQNPDSSPPCGIDESREHDVNSEEFEFNVDELKAQLGMDKILDAVGSLSNRVTKRKANEPERLSKRAKLAAHDQTSNLTTVFDPSLPVTGEMSATEGGDIDEYILPSIFAEADSFGPGCCERNAR